MSTFCPASSCTALRPSASVVIQCGTVMRPGSGMVIPRPALKNFAAPGIVSLRIGSNSMLSVPMLSAALTPKYARRFRSRVSSSRVGLRWTCVSMSIGITVLPARLTRAAPAGTRTSAAPPAWMILVPSRTSVAFSIGARPSPTMSRAPSNAVTPLAGACAWAGRAKPARMPKAAVAATVTTFTRRIGASTVKLDRCTVALFRAKGEGRTVVPDGSLSLDKDAPAESLSINGQERIQCARDPGRTGAERRAGHGERLGAHPAGLQGRHFVRSPVGRIIVPPGAGGRAEYAAQLCRRGPEAHGWMRGGGDGDDRTIAGQGAAVRDAGERDQGGRLGGRPGFVSDPAEAPHDGVPARGGASAAAHQRHRRGDQGAAHAGAGDPSVLRRQRLLLGQYADHHRVRRGGGGGTVPGIDAGSRQPTAHAT